MSTTFARDAVPEEESGSKMLLTCRTQYFRTIREETTYFVGQERHGLQGENYLALLMLPFREDQVRQYLATNLGRDQAWVEGFLTTMASVHNLPELARRPLTLRLIADQVEFIETAKLAGRTLRSVDLYREFVDRWLSRDSGKHSLHPEHKQVLMEQLAAGMWRSGKNSWEPAQVEDWLLDVLDQRPDLQRHYRQRVPDLWKADFRTATFLSRDGDTFSFGHRSLFEYFLASYLGRALTDTSATAGRVRESWAMPVPSPETLDFLGQSIAGLPDEQRSVALQALKLTTTEYVPQTSELAFAYALRAAEQGHPHQSLAGAQLSGAQLQGWVIGSTDTQAHHHRNRPRLLSLAGANLARAALRRARFHQVDLTGADLSGADLTNTEAHGCRLASARFSGARATGTILRECEIDGADLADAIIYQAQLLRCTPQPAQTTGWLVAPLPAHASQPLSESGELRLLTGHTGRVWSVAYSPDGTHILTGGDASVRVWDAATGQPVGFTIVTLPSDELAVFDATSQALTGASEGAWRWLGWNVVQDGRLTRLPAETYGSLPPLPPPQTHAARRRRPTVFHCRQEIGETSPSARAPHLRRLGARPLGRTGSCPKPAKHHVECASPGCLPVRIWSVWGWSWSDCRMTAALTACPQAVTRCFPRRDEFIIRHR